MVLYHGSTVEIIEPKILNTYRFLYLELDFMPQQTRNKLFAYLRRVYSKIVLM